MEVLDAAGVNATMRVTPAECDRFTSACAAARDKLAAGKSVLAVLSRPFTAEGAARKQQKAARMRASRKSATTTTLPFLGVSAAVVGAEMARMGLPPLVQGRDGMLRSQPTSTSWVGQRKKRRAAERAAAAAAAAAGTPANARGAAVAAACPAAAAAVAAECAPLFHVLVRPWQQPDGGGVGGEGNFSDSATVELSKREDPQAATSFAALLKQRVAASQQAAAGAHVAAPL
jgi:hypothetical protein